MGVRPHIVNCINNNGFWVWNFAKPGQLAGFCAIGSPISQKGIAPQKVPEERQL